MKREAVVVSALRTPVGRFRGGLAGASHSSLAALVMKEAVSRAKVNPGEIDEIFFGNLTGLWYNNMARYAALEAGIPVHVPATTIDKQCGTTITEAGFASMLIEAGQMDCVLIGGVNQDTRRPWVFDKPDQPFPLAYPKPMPPTTSPPQFNEPNMLVTAENLAKQYNLTREECDAFAVSSHKKAAAARNAGYFADTTVTVETNLGKGKVATVSTDETLREDTSIEALAKLSVVSGVEGGVCTAGNSSPFSDGASAAVIMEKSKAKALGANIMGTIRGYAAVGVDPHIMGIGPVPATRKLLEKIGMSLNDIDLFEFNEAFAAQTLACAKGLGVDMNKLNVNGGAIALGHPLAATGGILIAKMTTELMRQKLRYGVIAFCCGGGQGVAMLIENEM
ncbi:MAG: thiolase family protein [Defluviitaleaceae bacterium]|nr:thiolase family protein [Defluviitaleaceae bacterium]